MSVTVWIPEAPTKIVPCESCAIVAQHPDWPEHEAFGGKCWEHCEGTQEVSTAPEANWANGNAAQVFALLGLPVEEWGQIEANEVSNVLQTVNATLARGREQGLAREGRESGGERRMVVNAEGMPEIRTSCRVIECGSPAWMWTNRLEQFRAILSWAAQNGVGVSWG